jgi:hypothetical protein
MNFSWLSARTMERAQQLPVYYNRVGSGSTKYWANANAKHHNRNRDSSVQYLAGGRTKYITAVTIVLNIFGIAWTYYDDVQLTKI